VSIKRKINDLISLSFSSIYCEDFSGCRTDNEILAINPKLISKLPIKHSENNKHQLRHTIQRAAKSQTLSAYAGKGRTSSHLNVSNL
jgi:hypothetical protein